MKQNVTLNIRSGDWVIDKADVQLDNGCIVAVELQYGTHQPINAQLAETQRKFWAQEYARLNWPTTSLDVVATAIRVLMVANDEAFEPEDYWLEAQYEDRYVMSGF